MVEMTFTVGKSGTFKIPASVLAEMGIAAGDHIRIAYLTDDGVHNAFREFFLSPEELAQPEETQQIAVPADLLRQANIHDNSDIQLICLAGAVALIREDGLSPLDLANVLESLRTANGMLSGLPDDPVQAVEQLKTAVEYFSEADL